MSTPTLALFYQDDYAREMDATVQTTNGPQVALDRTVFYPRGGNQDCDTGTLAQQADGAAPLAVVEVLKDEAGVVHHRLATAPAWPPGAALHGALDWERRYLLMRLHT